MTKKLITSADKQNVLKYLITVTVWGFLGFIFVGTIGAVIGAILGLVLINRLKNDKKYSESVVNRRKMVAPIMLYLTIGSAGFVFGGIIGTIIGVGLAYYVLKK